MASNEEKNGQPEMERWLDAALQARVDAEPREGLEERVLARLASEPPRQSLAWWPMVSAVAAMVILALALILWMRSSSESEVANQTQRPVNHSTSSVPADRTPSVVAENRPDVQKRHVRTPGRDATCCVSAGRVVAVRASAGVKRQRLPMLATFPVATPPTRQERMLARLAAQHGLKSVAELQIVSVPEFKIQPMEETPTDDTPQD